MIGRITLAIVAVVGIAVAYILSGVGLFTRIQPIGVDACRTVSGVPGAEDIVIDEHTGIAYLSSYNQQTAGIYAYDLTTGVAPTLVYSRDKFMPLGLSLWQEEDGTSRLFVVNRAAAAIEWYDFTSANKLRFVDSITSPHLPYPNNVAAVGKQSFYATNTHDSTPGSLMRWLETLFRFGSGSVIYFDGDADRVVATDIGYANGIALDHERSEVFVGSISNWLVLRYERKGNGDLVEADRISLPGGVDNLAVSADGRLLAGLHPKSLDALAHLSGSQPYAPSRIVRFETDDLDTVTTVYEDTGEQIPAAAGAVQWQDHMLIGPVVAERFLHCRGL